MAAVAFLLGVALVTVGAALIYTPAAFFICGLALILGAWFYVRGVRAAA